MKKSYFKKVALIMFILTTTCMMMFSAPAGMTNIALNKVVKTSSDFSVDFPASNLVDGNYATVWGSSTKQQAEWVYIDLGAVEEVNGLGLFWYQDFYAKKYQVYLSNDAKTWTKVAELPKNVAGDDIFADNIKINTRYMGFYFVTKNLSAIGLKELEVYQNIPTPTPTSTIISTPIPTTPPVADPSGELKVTYTTTTEDATSFTGKLVLENPNSSYAWNGTWFGIYDVEFETTSTITSVSSNMGGASFTQDGTKLIVNIDDWVSFFPYGKKYECTVKGSKAGNKVYPEHTKTNYCRGPIKFPEYDNLPGTWQKGKAVTMADLVKNEAEYYDANAQPITEHAIMYNPRVKTQVQIGLAPEVTFPASLPMNGVTKLRVYVPTKVLAMGLAYAQHEFGTNPNWLAAMSIKENWGCAVTDQPAGIGPVITIDGKDYKWPIIFGNADGPFQIEPGNFTQMSTYYRDYFPAGAAHGDYIPITSDLNNPNWISSAISCAISVTISREFVCADKDAGYNEFMELAKDPYAEVSLLTFAFNMGESETMGLASKDIFSVNRQAAINSTDICEDFVLYGDLDVHVPLVKIMIKAMDEETQHIYDEKIYWSDMELFLTEMRTFFANGVPSDADWTAMKADVKKAFDVLKTHWGADYISYRYDFMTLLSIFRRYRPYPYHPRPVTDDWYYNATQYKF